MNRSKPIATILCASLLALFWGLPHRTRSCPPGLPQVYLLATDPTASEVGPDPGKFRVYRNGGDTSVPLVVYFLQPHGGTAQNGTDYQTLPEYAIIPADSNSVEVLVTPILDANCNEGNETVILTLATNANYWLAWPTNATVTLADVPPNSDNDGDNMLDCWELQHFGNLGQTAGGDYDRDGVNNVDEFNAGTDPNDIWFDTQIESPYVNQRLLQGACVVHGGVPHQMAVLVNSTNLTSVTWSNYTPNFSAWLPDADGSHTVLVALRGRTTQFAPVTDETEVTLDRVPPLLVITNPVTETVSKPFLQVQGYANEPLGAMHYDLTNTAGCFSNGLMVVLEQEFDTNAFDFTTNYFQAFDLELTNGLNQIVLTMSDRAGNVVTTNLAVTLDYTSATNPPLLELLWPTNGAHLSGTNLYVRGRISDETARLR
ncbi:MAG: hypothetical protein RMK20_11615, partial [Verrucomicrobiales bacterium]|nr:hypothetical protein [Verrucomicrobiales bacterium]